jgi:hypothetical protein
MINRKLIEDLACDFNKEVYNFFEKRLSQYGVINRPVLNELIFTFSEGRESLVVKSSSVDAGFNILNDILKRNRLTCIQFVWDFRANIISDRENGVDDISNYLDWISEDLERVLLQNSPADSVSVEGGEKGFGAVTVRINIA